jgi:predicted  nucleic acid-binding Zn-ribbon protein
MTAYNRTQLRNMRRSDVVAALRHELAVLDRNIAAIDRKIRKLEEDHERLVAERRVKMVRINGVAVW